MKKLFFTTFIASLLVFNFAQSQEETKDQGLKGAWWGLASANYSKTKGSDAVFTILPAVGVFVSPTITVGGALGYTNAIGGDDTFVVKPLARKYWVISDKFFIFAEANVPLLFSENFSGYGFNIEPGIDYFIGGRWTIEAKFGRFGYNSIKPDGGSAVGTTTLGFNMFDRQTQEGLGSGMTLGLKFLF